MIDSSDKDAEPVAVEVKDYIPKVVITIGYAGYLLLATESIEGLIILGLAVLFLVILYIVAELLKKNRRMIMMKQIQNPDMLRARRNLREKRRQERSVIKKRNARLRKRKGHAGKERLRNERKLKQAVLWMKSMKMSWNL